MNFKVTRTGETENYRSRGNSDWLDGALDRVIEAAKYKTAVEPMPTAVDQARNREAQVFQRMFNILNGGSPVYATVDEVVTDLKHRTGLERFKKQAVAERILKASEESAKKKIPIAIKKNPDIDITISTYIKENPQTGIYPVKVYLIDNNVVKHDDFDADLTAYISEKIAELGNRSMKDVGALVYEIDRDDTVNNDDPFALLDHSGK